MEEQSVNQQQAGRRGASSSGQGFSRLEIQQVSKKSKMLSGRRPSSRSVPDIRCYLSSKAPTRLLPTVLQTSPTQSPAGRPDPHRDCDPSFQPVYTPDCLPRAPASALPRQAGLQDTCTPLPQPRGSCPWSRTPSSPPALRSYSLACLPNPISSPGIPCSAMSPPAQIHLSSGAQL